MISAMLHAIGYSDTPSIPWFWLFGRVIHCPFILDFFLYYEGGVVNGEVHGVRRMTTRLIFCVYGIAAWVKKSGHGFLYSFCTVAKYVQWRNVRK